MAGGFKKCPYCAEEILAEAIKCKHCHELIDRKARTRARKEANKKETSPVTMGCAVLLAVLVGSCALLVGMDAMVPGNRGVNMTTPAPGELFVASAIVLTIPGAPDMAINLWEVPFGGGGTGRGRIVGSLSPPARVEISRRARRAGEDRYYYLVSRGDQRGWVPETMVEIDR